MLRNCVELFVLFSNPIHLVLTAVKIWPRPVAFEGVISLPPCLNTIATEAYRAGHETLTQT